MPDEQGRLRSAVTVVLRGAGRLTAAHRELHPVYAANGIPLHITLLFPFVPQALLGDDETSRLEQVLARQPRLTFDLVSVATFAEAVYAVPSPDGGLRSLMRAVWKAFPETPPYGGAFDDPAPHATLAPVPDGEAAAAVEARVAARVADILPLSFVVSEVTLLEEYEPQRWRERQSFALGLHPGDGA